MVKVTPWPLDHDPSGIKVINCFSEKLLGKLKPNFIWSLFGLGKWTFIWMVQVTWSRWRPWPFMIKAFQKSSLEPVGWLPWNLVCSIWNSGPSWFVQMMTLGWPWPILWQGQIWMHAFVWGKNCLTLGQLKQNCIWSLYGNGEQMLSQMVQVTCPRCLPCPYMVKTFQKSSFLEPVGRSSWNLVCNIRDSGPSQFAQMMT